MGAQVLIPDAPAYNQADKLLIFPETTNDILYLLILNIFFHGFSPSPRIHLLNTSYP